MNTTTMKTTTIMLSLLTACIAAGQMPTNATNRVSVPRGLDISGRTNLAPVSRAIEVASMLRDGMPLPDAYSFLERHGITIPLDPKGTNNARNKPRLDGRGGSMRQFVRDDD